jgi:hypothetical protein
MCLEIDVVVIVIQIRVIAVTEPLQGDVQVIGIVVTILDVGTIFAGLACRGGGATIGCLVGHLILMLVGNFLDSGRIDVPDFRFARRRLLLWWAVARAAASTATATATAAFTLAFAFVRGIAGGFGWLSADEELERLFDFFEDKARTHLFDFVERLSRWRRLAVCRRFVTSWRLAPGGQRFSVTLLRFARATLVAPRLSFGMPLARRTLFALLVPLLSDWLWTGRFLAGRFLAGRLGTRHARLARARRRRRRWQAQIGR